MANETKYGVISDVHQDPRIVPLAIDVLKRQGAEKLLINGDIGNHQETPEESQQYVGFILDAIGKSGLESFVQPGSHETVGAYAPVIDYFTSKYPNIVDVLKTPKVEQKGHDLVFLPGSDFLCGGQYMLGNGLPSGKHLQISRTPNRILLQSWEEAEGYINQLKEDEDFAFSNYTNINDLKKLVTAPEKTVVVCHIPRKFANIESCVDMSEFGEAVDTFHRWNVEYQNGQAGILMTHGLFDDALLKYFKEQGVAKVGDMNVVHEGAVYPLSAARQVLSQFPNMPISIKKENRGNADLAKLYQELGITKAVSGHFHESGHRANDSESRPVEEGKLVTDLFWNSGHLDIGQTGILTVDGEKTSYQNIRLQDYLK
jgi:Icc-related predicted phosphoesterase